MADNEEINEQFKSSIKAIEELQSTIGKLSGLQSTQEQSSQSLITASEKLTELTDSLNAATPEIQNTLVSVSESLDTAQQFLAETDLTAIIKEIEELKEGQKVISTQNEDLLSAISELKTEIAETSRVAEDRREAVESELVELKAKVDTLSDRAKKKLGI